MGPPPQSPPNGQVSPLTTHAVPSGRPRRASSTRPAPSPPPTPSTSSPVTVLSSLVPIPSLVSMVSLAPSTSLSSTTRPRMPMEAYNSTCWDINVSCVDNGAASAGLFFMENVNDHRNAKNGNYNIQIAGVQNGQTRSIQLNDNDGNGDGVQNITADFGVVSVTDDAWGNQYSDDGSFTVEVDAEQPFGQLFQ